MKATSGTQGLDYIAASDSTPPDLILLDTSLPEDSGLDVCRRIRALGMTQVGSGQAMGVGVVVTGSVGGSVGVDEVMDLSATACGCVGVGGAFWNISHYQTKRAWMYANTFKP